jgi:hypothetical protein
VVIGTDILCPKARELSSWSRVHLERRVLVNTGYALQLLVTAFCRLKNLSAVGLHDRKIKRSQRVGEDRARSGYGWSLPGKTCRKARPLGKSLRCPRLHHKPPDSIFPLVLHALSVAGARPRSVVVHPQGNLPGTCLNIMSGPLARPIILVISTLQTLHLSLHNEQGPLSIHKVGDDYLCGLQVLLQNTPFLEHLRLDFGLDGSTMPGKFVSWLSLHQNPTIGFPKVVELKFLATLDLGMLTAFPQSLLNVVSRFPSLNSVCFREITLEDSSAATHVRSIWPGFLFELADRVERQGAVKSVSFRDPAYKHLHSASSEPVYFATHDSPNGSKLGQTGDYRTRAYCDERSSSDVRVWLQNLATRIYHADSEGNDTDVDPSSGGDSSGDQSSEDDQSDGSLVGDQSLQDGEIARVVAATMYDFSGANDL